MIIKNLILQEEGQGLTEYAFILFLIAVTCAYVLGGLGRAILPFFQDVQGGLDG